MAVQRQLCMNFIWVADMIMYKINIDDYMKYKNNYRASYSLDNGVQTDNARADGFLVQWIVDCLLWNYNWTVTVE